MKREFIAINAENRIINVKTDEEIPFIFKREGMKNFFEIDNSSMIFVINNITLKKSINEILNLVEIIYIITFNFDNDTQINEIFNVEINEK